MSDVYAAIDLKHERRVAIKVLRAELAGTAADERFRREIALTATLSHPNILPLFDSGEGAGLLYFVTPLIDGASLKDRIRHHGPLPVPEVLDYASDIGGAIDYAHRVGVVHRDLKPDNVLIASGRALVADFGIARARSLLANLTHTGVALGTPTYMSPEQAMGDRDVGPATDVFALGCVVYEALAGTRRSSVTTFRRRSLGASRVHREPSAAFETTYPRRCRTRFPERSRWSPGSDFPRPVSSPRCYARQAHRLPVTRGRVYPRPEGECLLRVPAWRLRPRCWLSRSVPG
jgi:serine/threonine-protein kinase